MTDTAGEYIMAPPCAGRARRMLIVITLACFAIGLAPSAAMAVAPSLGGISPRGVQRGIETEVVFSGARLTDAKEILFYSPGVQVSKIVVVNDTTVKATL